MKKSIFFLIAMVMLLGALAGCTVTPQGTTDTLSPQTQTPLMESPTEFPAVIPVEEPTEFTMEDLIAGNLKNGDGTVQVEAAFGKPDSVNTYQEGATGYDVLEYFHPDGNKFVFIKGFDVEDFTIRSVKIVTDDAATARGLKVGSTQDDVLGSFRNDGTDTNILYAAEIREVGENYTLIIPPRGVISEDYDGEGRTVIAYAVPVHPYNLDEISEYMFQEHGILWFVIQDGTVVEYGWFVGAMAE